MKTKTTIVTAAAALLFLFIVAAMIIPSLPTYEFATIEQAKSFECGEGEQIEDQLGDTNGPFRLKSAIVGGRLHTNFNFSVSFGGRTTNWSRPKPDGVSFRAAIFENRRGNQFAVVTRPIASQPTDR